MSFGCAPAHSKLPMLHSLQWPQPASTNFIRN